MDKFIFPLIFFGSIAFFILGLFLMSYLSGWRSLVRDFPDSEENKLSGDSYYFQTLVLSFFFGFRNSMNITVKPNGLEMRPLFPFSIACPRVFIPWVEVKEVNTNSGILSSGVQIVLNDRKFSIQGNSTKVIRKR